MGHEFIIVGGGNGQKDMMRKGFCNQSNRK